MAEMYQRDVQEIKAILTAQGAWSSGGLFH